VPFGFFGGIDDGGGGRSGRFPFLDRGEFLGFGQEGGEGVRVNSVRARREIRDNGRI
jgi:hypothetical protein